MWLEDVGDVMLQFTAIATQHEAGTQAYIVNFGCINYIKKCKYLGVGGVIITCK
jgi:hypothetical protein